MTDRVGDTPLRPVIVGTLTVCLAVAMAPWFSGGQEPVAMLVGGFALLLATLLVWKQPGVRLLKRGPLSISYAALVGFGLMSLLWTANRYSSVVWLVHWVMAGLAFSVAYKLAGEDAGREWVIRAYLVSAGVFCVAGAAMFLTSDYERLTGTFYWANPAAAYLMPAVIIGWDRLRRAGGRAALLWVAAGVLFLGSFLLTGSRAGTVVLALVAAVYLAISVTTRAFWIRLLFTVGLAFGLSTGLAGLSNIVAHHGSNIVPGSRFQEAASGDSKSMSDRIYYLGSAVNMWFDHAPGGTGAGTYGDVHPQYQQRVVSASKNAHNIYVQTLAELGLVGFVALMSVLLWLGAGMLRGMVAAPQTVAVVLAVGAVALHAGLDIDAGYPAILMLAAVLLGVVYRPRQAAAGRAHWAAPAVAAVLLVPVVSLYLSGVWADRGRLAQEENDYPTAAERYGTARGGLVYDPDYVNAEGINQYVLAAAGIQRSANIELALQRAREAEKLDPYDGQHYQLEGRVLAFKGDVAGAQGAFAKALALDRFNHPGYALDLASVQVKAGAAEAGMKTALSMLSLYPDDVLGNRSLDVTIRPDLANLEALVGNVYLRQGKIREARTAASRALKYDLKSLRGQALKVQAEKLSPAPAGQPQVSGQQ